MVAMLEQKNMPKDSPILVRIFKEESELEVWKQDTTGHFQLLKVYPICRWSGDLGPKVHEGDRQAPEGFYTITPGLMNPNSNYYLAINTGFPNAFDRANDRHGAFLMIHGDCSSRGCYAMTDEQIGEIYSLAREVVSRRPAVVPDPGLSVPHDAGESGAPSHQSEHGLLEDDQGRQRPFRGDASRAQGRRLRQALRVRRGAAARIHRRRSPSIRPGTARLSWSSRKSPDRRWRRNTPTRPSMRALVKANVADGADSFRPRRRDEPGVPRAGRRQHSAGARSAARALPQQPPPVAAARQRRQLSRRWQADCSAASSAATAQVAAADTGTLERRSEPTATRRPTPQAQAAHQRADGREREAERARSRARATRPKPKRPARNRQERRCRKSPPRSRSLRRSSRKPTPHRRRQRCR